MSKVRPIDANELCRQMDIRAASGPDSQIRVWAKAECLVMDMPTVDVSGTARWIYRRDLYGIPTCSHCGKTVKTPGYVGKREFYDEHFKFCPNCGHRITGGQDDGTADD